MELKSLIVISILFGSSLAEGLSCNYKYWYSVEGYLYSCELSIQNPEGFDNFTSIGGTHLEGRSDSEVLNILSRLNSVSPVFPRILCSQFENINEINIGMLYLERILEESFSNCLNLKKLVLYFNRIEELHERAFIHNTKLNSLRLSSNRIAIIPENIFDSLVNLNYLDISENPIEFIPDGLFKGLINLEMIVLKSLNIHSINPAWFDNIPNLKGLSLYNNNLTSLAEDAFANLGNLWILSIDTNPIGDNIAPEIFSTLPNLQQLYIGGTGMTKLNPDWFKSLSNLEELNTYNNLLDSIPEGIFDNLTRMKYLNLGGNRLTESRIPGNVFDNLSQLSELIVEVNNIENLNPEWFQNLHQLSVLSLNDNDIGNLPNGIFAPINNLRQLKMDRNNLKTINRDAFGNIQNLETASFEQNQINAIDERFLREAGPLYSFHLNNNICINDRFYSFGNNRNLTAFNICTRNFELIVETTTERGHPYKFFQVPSTTGINLRVKTDQEVHISLTSLNFLWNPSIEIIIGTGNNTLSTVIRNQNTRVVVVQSPKIIRLGQWTGLRITWVNNIILVTREGQEYPFLAYSMEDIFLIQFYGLQSPKSQADWSILPIYVETIPTDDV